MSQRPTVPHSSSVAFGLHSQLLVSAELNPNSYWLSLLVLLVGAVMGVKGFVEGGIASIVAGCSTHPLDLIKVRMQLQGESLPAAPTQAAHSLRPPSPSIPRRSPPPASTSPAAARAGLVSVGVRIVRAEGVAALFSGVSATVLRQSLYSTTRMGLYEILKQKWSDPGTNTLPLTRKITAGLVAGAVGAMVGNPADVAMVRMQADGRLPVHQRRNYRSVVDALASMSKQEGWRACGAGPASR
ncbi:hypothetical protein NL676_024698 [Syzygium grande]|nr:hypothetical protein NL676_024698 [Syzygium grande]